MTLSEISDVLKNRKSNNVWIKKQGFANFLRGLGSTILDFGGHMVCVAATQLCLCSVKAVTDNMESNGCGCVPIRLYLQK